MSNISTPENKAGLLLQEKPGLFMVSRTVKTFPAGTVGTSFGGAAARPNALQVQIALETETDSPFGESVSVFSQVVLRGRPALRNKKRYG